MRAARETGQSTGPQTAGYSNVASTRRDWDSAMNVRLFPVTSSASGVGKTSDMGTP